MARSKKPPLEDLKKNLLQEQKNAFEALTEIISLAKSYNQLFFVDWQKYAEFQGEGPKRAVTEILTQISENRTASAGHHVKFYSSMLKLDRYIGRLPNREKLILGLMSSWNIFMQEETIYRHAKRARHIAEGQASLELGELVSEAINRENQRFAVWAYEKGQENGDGIVDLRGYRPGVDDFFHIEDVVKIFTFFDLGLNKIKPHPLPFCPEVFAYEAFGLEYNLKHIKDFCEKINIFAV